MDAFIAECEEAWQWILKSYCLQGAGHKDGDANHYGHGCGYGHGYGHHGHHDKSVPIEEHDDVLAYGQDLDIKGIEDLDLKIQKSVDLTLEGVAEKVAELTASVEEAQTAVNASVVEEREFLEASL